MSDPIPVEIIERKPSSDAIAQHVLARWILVPAIAITLAWWFFASWFPQLGITWWALVLPYAVLHAWALPTRMSTRRTTETQEDDK